MAKALKPNTTQPPDENDEDDMPSSPDLLAASPPANRAEQPPAKKPGRPSDAELRERDKPVKMNGRRLHNCPRCGRVFNPKVVAGPVTSKDIIGGKRYQWPCCMVMGIVTFDKDGKWDLWWRIR
jgi:hypothetical protein